LTWWATPVTSDYQHKAFLFQLRFMTNRVIKPLIGAGVIILLAGLLTGCGSCKPGKPGPVGRYTIEVVLDESLKTSSVIVDLIGVNPSTQPRWEAYDMGKYWREGDPMRRDADKVVFNFVSGQALTNSLATTDAQWDKWKGMGVTDVLVLADLPGAQTSRPGSQDARRLILSLDECNWPSKTKTLKVLVQRSGMVVLTPTRTAK
jgi:hypothetical protein